MKLNDPLPSISPYTFGTAELGKAEANLKRDLRLTRAAMEKGIWFHTSREYNMGSTFMALRMAFDEARSERPRLIVKIRSESAAHLRFDVEDALRRLDIDSIDVVQLCKRTHKRREVVDDFRTEGPLFETCRILKDEGLVNRFVLEVFESCSEDALKAVEGSLFSGLVFYFNVLEREATQSLYSKIKERNCRVVALRTLASGLFPGVNAEEFNQHAVKMRNFRRMEGFLDLYEQSGCSSWLEFNLSYLKSIENVVTSVGATSQLSHLSLYVETADRCPRLSKKLLDEIETRQSHLISSIRLPG